MSKKNVLVHFWHQLLKQGGEKDYDRKIIVMVVSLVVFIFCAVGGFIFWTYNNPVNLGPLNFVVKTIPYPAAIADGKVVRLSNWQTEYSAWKRASEIQGSAISEPQIRVDVLNKMIYDAILEKFAKEYDVTVNDADLENEINYIATNEFDSREAMEEEMQNIFGWDIELFKKRLIYPSVLAQKIAAEYNKQDEIWQNAEAQANEILEKINQGEDFATLATNFSQDTGSAAVGGSLGWFGRGEMVEEFENAAFSLEVGQVSGLVKTVYGYHIIKVDDIEEVEVEGSEELEKQVSARHILITPKPFGDLLNERVEEARVWTWIDIDKSLLK